MGNGRKLFLSILLLTNAVQASSDVSDGTIHMRGSLVNGGCAVAQQSQNLYVDMGQYRTDMFSGKGSFATAIVPFALELVECDADVWRYVGIAFQGVTPAADPQVFLATNWPDSAGGDSGIGLAIFNDQQQHIIPNAAPLHFTPIVTDKVTYHFSARYRALSGTFIPGKVQSDVWFTLVYP
ncbi:type 1 fimbrial protein subunit FimI [Metakosakonia massiliensis]|uniref:Type-1 fimbrial protein, A chain n=1 Tax=Phytobacter massiliensis TaxID=1485952 RepID=A0A6N2ZPE9_9ENTR|nr:type 1 fimbrial protein subunit FimI [Phytobacter massiliensis]